MASPRGAVRDDGWLESDGWLSRARRRGPLRYSDLGPRRLLPLAEADIGPLSSWIAAVSDRWWDEAGRPDPFTLVVVSSDGGALAGAVLARDPACAPALRYVLVDPAYTGAEFPPGMARLVPLEEPAFLYPSAAVPAHSTAGELEDDNEPDDDDLADLDDGPGERPPARGIGPLATFLREVPALGDQDGAMVAVGCLSRLPYEEFERRDGEWCEVRVAASGDELVEIAVPLGDGPEAAGVATLAHDGRWRRLSGAADWLRRQLPTGATGHLAVVDRWSGAGDYDALDLRQLRLVREPLGAGPEVVEGTGLSAVTWRLG